MLEVSCPTCNVPLMRNRDMQTVCLGCNRDFVVDERGAIPVCFLKNM